ncbi:MULTISPECIES: ATP-binding cassette domain-containing protein [Peptoniphilus]|uniref:ATP-binding cassette domain-containing protein n=1 Tax=Peptoniphilus TaxID=162289 RepID=UPI00030D31F7|nr:MULTISPECIES: ABC transporter ATP-binding protein [Peptoniphilus]
MLMEISNLSASYGKNLILNSIYFTIEKGQSICILGENGCGKSTLLKSICGLKKYSGEIKYSDSLKIYYLPQDNVLIEDINVYDNIKLFLNNTSDIKNNKYIKLFEIDKIFKNKVSSLSGGTKKKVSLCLSLMEDNDLLILDEPFANLDSKNKSLFLDIFKTKKLNGLSILYTSHLNDMSAASDIKLYLKDGKLEVMV